MQSFPGIIEEKLTNKLFSSLTPLTITNRGEQNFMFLCVLFLGIGSGFLIYAAFLWLSGNYSADIAAALTGFVSFSFAVVFAIVVYTIIEYRRIRVKQLRQSVVEKMKLAFSTFEDEYGDPIRENPKLSILLASLTGFILEERLF